MAIYSRESKREIRKQTTKMYFEGTLSPDRSTRAAQKRILTELLNGKAVIGYHPEAANLPKELNKPVTKRKYIPHPEGDEKHLPVFFHEALALREKGILHGVMQKKGALMNTYKYRINPERLNQVKALIETRKKKD